MFAKQMAKFLATGVRFRAMVELKDRQVVGGQSFGVRADRVPGPSNDAIAAGMSALCTRYYIPAVPQWEIAASTKFKVPESVEVRVVQEGERAPAQPHPFWKQALLGFVLKATGQYEAHSDPNYIDSYDVLYRLVEYCAQHQLTRVAVVCYFYHAKRIVRTVEKLGRARGLNLDVMALYHHVPPDPESLHPATRSEEDWLSYEWKAWAWYKLNGWI